MKNSLLTTTQSRDLDRIAIQERGIPGIYLMGNAGRRVAEYARERLTHLETPRVAVVCGRGNNGGDGFVTAELLSRWHCAVTIYNLPEARAISGDPRYFYDRCTGGEITLVHGTAVPEEKSEYDCVIDALLGTGFSGRLRAPLDKWIGWINSQPGLIISVDCPSGIDAATGNVPGAAVRADFTVTMGWIKVGMLLAPARDFCGRICAVEIGFPDLNEELTGRRWSFFDEKLASEYLAAPPRDTYKQRQGKVLVVAGSAGMTGAATLSTLAAIRSGAGLVVLAAPASLNPIYETKITEGMTLVCPDRDRGYLGLDNYSNLEPFLEWCDALVIGPGLGGAAETTALVRKLVENVDRPVVIDADGLRAFTGRHEEWPSSPGTLILTPHLGEAARLAGLETQSIRDDIPGFIEHFMEHFPGVLVLKNAPTIIAAGSQAVVNRSGNQGLATGGTGDVLTGVTGGLLAQGIPPFEAAQLAVFLQGRSADLLLQSQGYRGMLAGDVLEKVPEVIRTYEL